MLTTLKNTLTPVFLRFHSYDHLHQAAVYDTLRLARGLRAQRGLVQTLAARSLTFVMASKVVVIVGGWKMNKRHILETAVGLGVKVCVAIRGNHIQTAARSLQSHSDSNAQQAHSDRNAWQSHSDSNA